MVVEDRVQIKAACSEALCCTLGMAPNESLPMACSLYLGCPIGLRTKCPSMQQFPPDDRDLKLVTGTGNVACRVLSHPATERTHDRRPVVVRRSFAGRSSDAGRGAAGNGVRPRGPTPQGAAPPSRVSATLFDSPSPQRLAHRMKGFVQDSKAPVHVPAKRRWICPGAWEGPACRS